MTSTLEVKHGLARLIKEGNLDAVRQIIDNGSTLLELRYGGTDATLLHFSARYGTSELVRYFFDLGLTLNTTDTFDTPLACMVDDDNLEMFEWMLANGADVNFTRWPVINAVSSGSLRMMRRLVDEGADYNFVFGEPPRTPLSQARAFGHEAVAEYLESLGAIMPPGHERFKEMDDKTLFAATVNELREYFKYHTDCEPNAESLQEIVPGVVRVAVSTVETGENKLIYTAGMSAKAMQVPEGCEEYAFAELVMYLPADWPTIEKADDPQAWPWRWLRTLAHYPNENATWLAGPLSTFANGDPSQPLDPTTTFTAFLLSYNFGFKGFLSDDGRGINMITVVPIYTEELQLAQSEGGFRKLGALFDQHGIRTALRPEHLNAGKLQ